MYHQPVKTTIRVPNLTGTWWESKHCGRTIQLIGRLGTDTFVARGSRKTYRITIYTIRGQYRQIPPPDKRQKAPDQNREVPAGG